MRKPQSEATRERVHAVLRERWPHLFSFPVPLKIGVHKDFRDLARRPVGRDAFDLFLRWWTQQDAYKQVVATARARYDFDGRIWPMQPERKR